MQMCRKWLNVHRRRPEVTKAVPGLGLTNGTNGLPSNQSWIPFVFGYSQAGSNLGGRAALPILTQTLHVCRICLH